MENMMSLMARNELKAPVEQKQQKMAALRNCHGLDEIESH
jgi:hypothetical protein